MRCPFDEDAVLLSGGKTASLLEAAGMTEIERQYFLLFPSANPARGASKAGCPRRRLARNMSAAPVSDTSMTEGGEAAAGFASAAKQADLKPIWQTLGVLAFALAWQLVWGVNIDTSWIITMCERVLAGDRLYVDIVETNPPMTLWMYLPAVFAARLIGIEPEIAVHAYFYLACAGGLGFAAYLARLARFPENPALYKLLPVFFALLVILPARSFGEREQFGVALLLPLLVLMAWRVTADADDQPGLALAILAGLCGSVIVLVKPYYAVVILVPALYVAWRRGGLRWLFTPEYWTIGLVCVAYLAAVMQLYPEFVRDVYPALSETYMRDRAPLVTVARYVPTFLLILFFFWRVRPGVPTPPLIMIVMITATAALAPLIYQSKAWAYHAYPVFALALAAFAYRATQPSDEPRARGLVPKLSAALIVVATACPLHLPSRPTPHSCRPCANWCATQKSASSAKTSRSATRSRGDRRHMVRQLLQRLGGQYGALFRHRGQEGRQRDAVAALRADLSKLYRRQGEGVPASRAANPARSERQ